MAIIGDVLVEASVTAASAAMPDEAPEGDSCSLDVTGGGLGGLFLAVVGVFSVFPATPGEAPKGDSCFFDADG